MLLLVTNRRDVTSDYVVLELQRRGLSYGRLNTEDLAAAHARWRFAPPNGSGWALRLHDRWVDADEIGAAYLRRPVPPVLPAGLGAGDHRYAAAEWGALLDNLCAHLSGRWLNEPAAVARAENKTLQIAVAAEVGFKVPETLVCNDVEAIAAFTARHSAVVKPLRSGLVDNGEDGQRIAFTTRLEGLVTSNDQAAVESAPFIVQREIPKRCDVRATAVGRRVFAAEIDSQARAETAVDWRRGAASDLAHAPHELPASVEAACLCLLDRLGLRFGAVDLVLDRDGEYWFLEINPNGQWAWIEALTGLPIAAALVDELIEVARS